MLKDNIFCKETSVETNPLLHTLFDKVAVTYPNKIAILYEGIEITYGELYNKSLYLTNCLLTKKLQIGTIVPIIFHKGLEQIICVLGILRAGLAYLPIDLESPEDRIITLLSIAKSSVVVTCHEIDRTLLKNIKCSKIYLEQIILNSINYDDQFINIKILPDSLAYIMFTSGSTGIPKGVMISHKSATNTIWDINNKFEVNENDKILAVSSLHFDLSVYDIFGILSVGGTLVIPNFNEIKDPVALYKLIKYTEVTIWNSVPMIMDTLVEYIEINGYCLENLRLIMLSGDWIPVKLPLSLRKYSRKDNMQIVSLGGATEASIWSIYYTIKNVNLEWKSIPYGKPLKKQTVYVMDYELNICPSWTVGELYIGGQGIALGYLGNEEQTIKSFIIHPKTSERLYKTGDWGKYLPDGNIEFVGRKDLQVKIRGYRVELCEIESVILKYEGIDKAIVIPINNSNDLSAFIVLKMSVIINKDDLRNFLKNKLPPYMIPINFTILDKLPLTSIGKIDRSCLEEMLNSQNKPSQPEEASDHSLNETVKDIVCEIMHVDNLSFNDNLIEKGINSIEVVRIANALEKQFHYRPPLNVFYKEPTISAIVKKYSENIRTLQNITPPLVGLNKSNGWTTNDLILIGKDKEEFKDKQKNIRNDLIDTAIVELEKAAKEESSRYLINRSYRDFLKVEINNKYFSKFIACLQYINLNHKPKYLYPSAGGLYPIHTYFYIKKNTIEGISGGTYYYHPGHHSLVYITDGMKITPEIHDPFINRSIAEKSAFSIFLIAKKSSIVPVYNNMSRDYCLLEAGYMGMLLMSEAIKYNIGLCAIGELDFDRVKDQFLLDDDYELVHMLLGGAIMQDEIHMNVNKTNMLINYEEGEL